jgi:hypothetical protein
MACRCSVLQLQLVGSGRTDPLCCGMVMHGLALALIWSMTGQSAIAIHRPNKGEFDYPDIRLSVARARWHCCNMLAGLTSGDCIVHNPEG